MNFDFFNEHEALSFSKESLEQFLNALQLVKPLKYKQLSLAFLSKDTIVQLHGKFLNDFSCTDVIAFPIDECPEICVCVDQAKDVAAKYNNSVKEELSLYVVHGWLHLAGYDDLKDSDRVKMREAEKLCMQKLKEQSVLPDFAFS